MPNQSAATNHHPTMRVLPTPQPLDVSDPVPAWRREITLLRIELDQLRALEEDARKTKEFLFAHIERIMNSRDEWQREVERLSALIAQMSCSEHAATPPKPGWWLFAWRNIKWPHLPHSSALKIAAR